MAEMSLGRAVTRLAERRPDDVAVFDAHGKTTWRELDGESNAIAHELLRRGVRRDDVVTYLLPSDARFVALTVAVWKAGATPQPLAPTTAAPELARVVAASSPRLVITAEDRLDGRDVSPPPDTWARSWKAPVSGGSTGPPKVIFSAAPARIDPDAPTAPYIPARAVQLTPAPLHHSAAFLFAMRGLLLGHTLVVMQRFDPSLALRLIEEHKVTWAVLSPSAMQRIWRLGPEARGRCDVSSLKSVLHVGAACPPWLKRAWLDWLGVECVEEIYSGTESIGVTHIGGADWLRHPGSVGRAVQGTSVRILDEHGDPVPAGRIGRVHLRPRSGPGSTYRYGDGASVARAHDGHETLGDLGWLDADGYLYLADRAADVIATRHGPVYPATVEAVLDEHPAVRTSAALGRPAGDTNTVAAVVDVADADVAAEEMLAWCRERLPAHVVPATIDVVREPVRDDVGKVRRAAL